MVSGADMAGDENGADGDAVADDDCMSCWLGGAGVAVAEDDDVLEVGGGFLEGLVGLFEDALEAAMSPWFMPAICRRQVCLVADFLEREDPVLGAVPEQHAHFVGGAEGGQHALGAIAGDLVAVVELHAVHDEHDGAAGQDLLAVQFHAHRQGGFERGAAVAAGGVGLVAADADQADAEIAHGAFEQFLAVGAQVAGGDIADEDGVVALHLGERAGECLDADQIDFEARRSCSAAASGLVLLGVGRDDQDARVRRDGGEAGGALFCGIGIAGRIHLHVVAVEAGLGRVWGKVKRFLPADSSTFCSPRNCSLRKSRTVAGVAWSAWTKILTSKAWPFLSLGGHLELLAPRHRWRG